VQACLCKEIHLKKFRGGRSIKHEKITDIGIINDEIFGLKKNTKKLGIIRINLQGML